MDSMISHHKKWVFNLFLIHFEFLLNVLKLFKVTYFSDDFMCESELFMNF